MPTLTSISYTAQPSDAVDFQIARTILSQVGMSVKAALSLRDYKIISKGVMMTLGVKGTTMRCLITLNGWDLYTLTIGRLNRKTGEFKALYVADSIYNDQLTEIIGYGYEQANA